MENEYYVGLLLKQMVDKMINMAADDAKEYSLSLTHAQVILYLKGCEQCMATQKEIENYLNVSHPTLISVMKNLEQRNIIRCETFPNDRRLKQVHLIDQQNEVNQFLVDKMNQFESSLTKGFSQQEYEQYLNYLIRSYRNICE